MSDILPSEVIPTHFLTNTNHIYNRDYDGAVGDGVVCCKYGDELRKR